MKRALALLGSVTLVWLTCACDRPADAGGTLAIQARSSGTASAVKRYDGPLPPVPSSPHAAAPPEVMRAVYEFAARRPDVLRYVPCFCGCERNGHRGNEDCFVARRAPDGRPEWEVHGLT